MKQASKLKSQTVTVLTSEEKPLPLEVIKEQILEVSKAFKQLKNSSLRERVILLLIKDVTGLPMGDIVKVIDACEKLETIFLKPQKKS